MSATTGGSKVTNGHKYSFEGDSLSQDLHLKMCKKIAQLTKVIYVLNTRNEEHETELEEISHQHKSELRQSVTQMGEKVEELERRIKAQTGDYNKVIELQDIIRSYEVLLDQTKTEYLNYKEDVKRHNKAKDSAHIEQFGQLNDKISTLESSYKDLYDDCEKMQQKTENEKNKSIKEIETRYEKEIFELKEEFTKKEKHLRDLISGSQKEIEIELIKTQEEVKAVTFLREKTINQYEDQIKELKKSFGIQLSETLEENKKLLEFELEEANAKLLEFQNRSADKEVTLHSLIEKHIKELREKDTLIEESEKQTELVTKDIKAKMLTISNYAKEVASLNDIITKWETDLRITKQDIDKRRKETESLNGEVELKSKQIKELKNSVETALQKLAHKDHELKDALKTIASMNQESKEMVDCTKSHSVDYEIQIQTLTRGLEELNNERIGEKQALERFHMNQEIEQADLVNLLKNEHNGEMDKFAKKLEKEWLGKEKAYKEEITKLKEDLQTKLEEERSKASKIIEKLKVESEQIKNDNIAKLKSKDKSICANETMIADRDKEIKSVLLKNKSVKEKLSNSKKENHSLTDLVTEKDVLIEKLTNDSVKLKESLEDQIAENEKIKKSVKAKMQEDMSEKYTQLSADLDKKWADTLRRESGRLRNDLLDNFAKEKEKIIENVERNKNEEMASIRREFEEINSNLVSEMSLYKDTLEKMNSQIAHEKEDMDKNNTDTISRLESELRKAESSHLSEMSRMNDAHQKQLENIAKQFERDRSQYIIEMESLLETTDREWKHKHETIIKSLTLENDKMMKRKMDEIINEHNREVNDQIREVQVQMSESQQNVMEDYKNQIRDLNHKVNSIENQSKIQMENHRVELDKIKSIKSASDNNFTKLEQSLQEILKENNYLKKQMEDFNDDYHRNQKEFTEKLKQKENDLKHHYEQVIHNNKVTYEDDSKQTLQDFNKAQNLFKDKIKELSGKLLEIEEKYQTRASRDEDIELIETLKAQLRTSEKEIERMNEEKKFLQLELKNRETNFNKIFNASPNVGKLDPTNAAIKSKKASNEKLKNIQKLTPLPGSPFHDDPINPARPLPPSRKSIDAS